MDVVTVSNLSMDLSGNSGFVGVIEEIPWINKITKLLPGNKQKIIVLTDINFSVAKGECFGIIGFNKAGKSTLCNILAKLIPHDRGALFIDGSPSLSNGIIYRAFNPMQNIEFAAKLYNLCPKAADSTARMLLSVLGVNEDDLKKQCDSLSKGTLAKVILVRDVVIAIREGQANPMLILDEPTLGFDAVAVKEFCNAITTLRTLIPELTIIIATNEIRDLVLCDRYIALYKGKQSQDLEKLKKLKDLYQSHLETSSGLLEAMLRGNDDVSTDGQPEPTKLNFSRIPLVKPSENPFFWRARTEIKENRVFTFILLLTIIVPNLFPIFNATIKSWPIFLGSICGIYFSLLMRNAYRVLGRESQHYLCLNLVLGSKYRGLRHLLACTRSGLIQDTFFALAASLILAAFYITSAGVPDFRNITPIMLLKFFLLLLSGTIFSKAVGYICAPLLKSMRPDNSFYLLSILPFMVLMLSGLFYESQSQPFGLRYIANLIPFTMLGEFLRGEYNQPIHYPVVLAIIWFGISLLSYKLALTAIYRAKRLRD